MPNVDFNIILHLHKVCQTELKLSVLDNVGTKIPLKAAKFKRIYRYLLHKSN